jgi:hypothetical protein
MSIASIAKTVVNNNSEDHLMPNTPCTFVIVQPAPTAAPRD